MTNLNQFYQICKLEQSLLFNECSVSELEIYDSKLSKLEISNSIISVYKRFEDDIAEINNQQEVAKRKQVFDISNSDIYELNINNTEFHSVINFDSSCSLKSSVDIDDISMSNLLESKSRSLEFSRLAEFLNRNNAYIEAQQLHRHYLLAKAKESKNYGLKFWVWFYSLVNGCGTSLLKPFIGVLYCWLFTYLIFLSSSIKLVMSVKSTGVIVYSSYSVLFSIKQALLVTVPLLATIHKPEIEMLDNGLLQIFVYFLMIVSYLLVFLIALQIRKLLKLKD